MLIRYVHVHLPFILHSLRVFDSLYWTHCLFYSSIHRLSCVNIYMCYYNDISDYMLVQVIIGLACIRWVFFYIRRWLLSRLCFHDFGKRGVTIWATSYCGFGIDSLRSWSILSEFHHHLRDIMDYALNLTSLTIYWWKTHTVSLYILSERVEY